MNPTVKQAASEMGATLLSIGYKPRTQTFINTDGIAKSALTEAYVDVDVLFLKEIYKNADETVQQQFEQKFPRIFARPTFVIGDRIKQFFKETDVDGTRDLLIAGTIKNSLAFNAQYNRIVLVDLRTGNIGEILPVRDVFRITEKELLEAGRSFGLTRNTYATFK